MSRPCPADRVPRSASSRRSTGGRALPQPRGAALPRCWSQRGRGLRHASRQTHLHHCTSFLTFQSDRFNIDRCHRRSRVPFTADRPFLHGAGCFSHAPTASFYGARYTVACFRRGPRGRPAPGRQRQRAEGARAAPQGNRQNSDFAATPAASINGPAKKANNTTNSPVTATIARTALSIGSNAGAGSSKYITFTTSR
jgi:hypothetical protein